MTQGHVRSLCAGICAAVFAVAVAAPSLAQVDKKSLEAPIKPATTTGTVGRSLFYNPPVRGNPQGRVGGGTRSGGLDRSVVLAVLTPDHVGQTTKEQPTLYWYISQPTNHSIEFTIVEAKSPKPLLETRIAAPAQPGIQKIRLADHNIKLKTGVEYRWYIALVPDPKNRSKDILAGGFIERVEPSETLRARLSHSNAATAYAEAGIWYDALAAISESIDAASSDATLRSERAFLLEQVELKVVADYERKEK